MIENPVQAPAPTGKWHAVMLAGTDAVARYWTAYVGYNRDEVTEDQYMAAFHAMNDFKAETCRDVVRKFIAMHDMGGSPDERRLQELLDQARCSLDEEA